MSSKSSVSHHSISQHFDGLRDGDAHSARIIWERYVDRLIRLAHKKLKGTPRRYVDQDDVVQVAFENFFRQVQQGRFPDLYDRDDLWQILAMLVDRKAKDQIKQLNRQKTGARRVHGDSINKCQSGPPLIDQAPDLIPSAQTAAELTESFEQLLAQLRNDEYRKVALLKLEGYTNQEIVERLGISLRTVERKLSEIRNTWYEQGICRSRCE